MAYGNGRRDEGRMLVVMEESWTLYLECGFSKMSVEGRHLTTLNSLKMRPNA